MEKRIYRGSIGDTLIVHQLDGKKVYLVSKRPNYKDDNAHVVCLEKKDAISLSIFLAELANQLPDND